MTFTAPAWWCAQVERRVCIQVPESFTDAAAKLLDKSREHHGGYLTVSLERPRKPRTTGERSQNHRINGFIQQICEATGNTNFAAIKMQMKVEAIGRGYPFETLPNGAAWPKSEADISTAEAAILIDTIEQIAAEWNVELREE
jgi:hypothetical protein